MMKKRFLHIRFAAVFSAVMAWLLLAIPVGAAPLRAANTVGRTTLRVNTATVYRDMPYLRNGVTYAPLRGVLHQLGCDDITWKDGEKTAVVQMHGETLAVQAGEKGIRKDGKLVPAAAPNVILDDRICVPVRTLAEVLHATVEWDGASRTAILRTQSGAVPDASDPDGDLYWLSRIIHAESGSEPYRGKLAVGNVVLNRVRSSSYPMTVYGVIFDTKDGVQFTPVQNGTVYEAPDADSIAAAKECLSGVSVSEEILYFFDPALSGGDWIRNHCRYCFTIGGHDFYA